MIEARDAKRSEEGRSAPRVRITRRARSCDLDLIGMQTLAKQLRLRASLTAFSELIGADTAQRQR